MTRFCEKCGKPVNPLAGFCYYCGKEMPRQTVMVGASETVFDPCCHCPACGRTAPEDGLYCGWCGGGLFEKPGGPGCYCPGCGQSVSPGAEVCGRCGFGITAWFAMQGSAAVSRGLSGDVCVMEKMTGTRFVFLDQEEVSLGRDPQNTVQIPCAWVSSEHASIHRSVGAMGVVDTRGELQDCDSANGLFINRRSERITRVNLADVREFNVAGSFTFSVTPSANAFIFRLTAILDEEECAKKGDPAGFERLRTIYWILADPDVAITVRKFDGEIDMACAPVNECVKIERNAGYYYLSDPGRKAKNQLLRKDGTGWPVNWQVIPVKP